MTSNRILELAYDVVGMGKELVSDEKLEAFYKAAHADGQKQMRERAAKEIKEWNIGFPSLIYAIRNLDITE